MTKRRRKRLVAEARALLFAKGGWLCNIDSTHHQVQFGPTCRQCTHPRAKRVRAVPVALRPRAPVAPSVGGEGYF